MFDFLLRQYVQYAFLIGILLAISSSLLSPFLVLSHQSLIADGLAHISFTGIILGILLANQPFFIAVPFVALASIAIKFLSERRSMNTDAVIGVVSAVSFAIGLIVISKSDGFNRVIEGMLVGNIFTVSNEELLMGGFVTLAIAVFVWTHYEKLLLITYDVEYARFSKIRKDLLSYILVILSSLLVVIGVRTIGTMLISALVIFPTLVASQWKHSFKSVLILGVGISVVLTIIGIFIAHFLATPAGSTIIVLYGVALAISIWAERTRRGA